MLIVTSALLLLIAWLCGTRRFVEAVLLTRSVCDPLFTLTKSVGRDDIGIGAALNLAIILVAIVCVASRPRLRIGPVASMWMPFLCVSLAAVAIAPDPAAAFRLFMLLVSHAAVFLLAYALVETVTDLRRILLIILAGSLAPTLMALMQLAFGWAETDDGTRVLSTFAHPNIYAFYLMTMLAIVFALLTETRFELTQRLRRGLTLYVPLLLTLLLMTKTRSAWVATGVILLVYALRFDRRALLYFLAVPVLLVAMPGLAERFADLQQGNYSDGYAKLNSYAFRILLWHGALEWAWERPILGWGLEGFAHYVAQFFPLPLDNDTIDSHSVFVQLFFEAGSLGLIAFLWIFLRLAAVLVPALRSGWPSAWIMTTLLLGYLFMAYSDNMLYYLIPTWYMWAAFGAYYAVLCKQRLPDQAVDRLPRLNIGPSPTLAYRRSRSS